LIMKTGTAELHKITRKRTTKNTEKEPRKKRNGIYLVNSFMHYCGVHIPS